MKKLLILIGSCLALAFKLLVLTFIWKFFFVPVGAPEVGPILMLIAMSFYKLFASSGEASIGRNEDTDEDTIFKIKRSFGTTLSIGIVCLFFLLVQ